MPFRFMFPGLRFRSEEFRESTRSAKSPMELIVQIPEQGDALATTR